MEAISLHGVLQANVLRILPLDKHFCKANCVRFGVHFLAEEANVCRRVEALDKVLRGGQHTTSTTCLVASGNDLAFLENIVTTFCQKDVHHGLDDVTARVVVTRFCIFRESTNQVFENISHLDIVDGLGVQIQLGKLLDDSKETVMLVHLVYLLLEIKTSRIAHDDFLHIRRECVQVTLEVGSDVLGIIQQLCQVKFAGIVELEPRNLAHGLVGVILVLLELLDNLILGCSQRTLKSADNHHRDNHVFVLVALVRPTKGICDTPDEVHFGGNIYWGIVISRINNLILGHVKNPYVTIRNIIKRAFFYPTYDLSERHIRLQGRLG